MVVRFFFFVCHQIDLGIGIHTLEQVELAVRGALKAAAQAEALSQAEPVAAETLLRLFPR